MKTKAKSKVKLSKTMTLTQFDNGYWYAVELKKFAETIGVPSANKLRKDELEKAIRFFLETGKLKSPTQRRLSQSGVRDVEKGLCLTLPVINYTSNKETKDFIKTEALRIAPDLERRSGVSYRLNRWREDQLTRGVKITYADLIHQYIFLNQSKERFAQIPQGRYINFISDYLAAERGATREKAVRAWEKLKKLDAPKNYRSWVKNQSSRPIRGAPAVQSGGHRKAGS